MKKTISLILISSMMLFSLCACSLFEKKVESIAFDESNITMTVGDSKSLGVSAEPSGVTLSKLTWSSSDNNIATVDDGMVRAVSKGSVVISVKTEEGKNASCNITVNDKEITGLSMNKSSATVKAGSTIQLEVSITPVDAPTGDLKWSSSNSGIATVNSDGFVTGVSEGVANITCKTSTGVEASCTITVNESTKKQDTKQDTNDDKSTVINNYYGYDGHYHPDYTYSSSDFVFPESSSRQLSHSEISATLNSMSGYSPSGSYAQDAINEIYARNGYVFKNAEIRAYYESKPWYYADYSFTTSDFNSTEKYNMKLLEQY